MKYNIVTGEKTTMEPKYIFITNVRKNELYQVKLVLKQLDINYIITKAEEGDIFRSIYFLNEEENMLKLKDFFELDYKISQRYKQKMIDSGFVKKEELTWDMVTYIGCEKEYFPDRDDTVLRDYIKNKIRKLDSFDNNNSDFEDINNYNFDPADDD